MQIKYNKVLSAHFIARMLLKFRGSKDCVLLVTTYVDFGHLGESSFY
jgi:hypothetical protein